MVDAISGSTSWADGLPTKHQLLERIDSLPISADAKALLHDLVSVSVEVGGRLIAVGRRIVAFVFDMVRDFPNTTFGLIVAFVISALIASVPIIGPILSAFLAPLLVAFGLAKGALADLQHRQITGRVKALESEFAAVVGKV